MRLTIDGTHFRDEHGRARLLRGVNLGGSSKLPKTPDGATHLKKGFFDHRNVSFVGRPFDLDEADEHFTRLKAWGLDFLRLLVTWEAVEHDGPGQYDTEYLDYLEAVVDRAAEHDILLFVDFHQDVWSRFTGGDGAPGWTLDAVGFDMHNFHETGAALVHQMHGDPFPRMQWATNYTKLATATMFTLFFAGDDFAPHTTIDGQPAQTYLQTHFIAMVQQVATRLKHKPNVLGYDCLNEPSGGFIGYGRLDRMNWRLKAGDMPSPFQAMLLGAGRAQTVGVWNLTLLGQQRLTRRVIDPQGQRAWVDGYAGVWRENGVWGLDSRGQPILLRPEHFKRVDGREVDFAQDYMRPFINRVAAAIREIDPTAMIFVEFDANNPSEVPSWTGSDARNIVFAPHWYEFVTLMTKRYYERLGLDTLKFRPVFGRQASRLAYAAQLAQYKLLALTKFHGVPTLIGETGIPYDLNGRVGYTQNEWDAHVKAVDDYMFALETNLLHATIWNYTADNSNTRGDLWNGEDLSIYSADQRVDADDINSGGRALEAVVRPYARAVAGDALRMEFDVNSGSFLFIFRHHRHVKEPTVLYVPNLQYPQGYRVEISDGRYEIDTEAQRLIYHHSGVPIPHIIQILPNDERLPLARTHQRMRWLPIVGLLAALIGLLLWWRRPRSE